MAESKDIDYKSKNIAFLGHELSNIDRDIEMIKENTNSMTKIVFYNGSGTKGELVVWRPLSKPLRDFLLGFFKNQKEKVYDEMKSKLLTKNKKS